MHIIIHNVCGIIVIDIITKDKQDFFRKYIFPPKHCNNLITLEKVLLSISVLWTDFPQNKLWTHAFLLRFTVEEMWVVPGGPLPWCRFNFVIWAMASASSPVKSHWIKSKQFNKSLNSRPLLPGLLWRGQGWCQICNSEDPCHGKGPGVSPGVLQEELFFFSIMTSDSRNDNCSGVGLLQGNPPWKNPSTATCPLPFAFDVPARKAKAY